MLGIYRFSDLHQCHSTRQGNIVDLIVAHPRRAAEIFSCDVKKGRYSCQENKTNLSSSLFFYIFPIRHH